MTRALVISAIVAGAILAVASPAVSLAQQSPIAGELTAAQVEAAVARAKQVQAEGKAEQAAAEWRPIVRYFEGRLKTVQVQLTQGRLCSDEPLREAQGMLAMARAGLADAEGRRDDLATELPKVITYHEWRLQRYRSLRALHVIPEAEMQAAQKEVEDDLRGARERLAALRASSGSKP
jgi:predicted component of type VI protein secretion system